MLYMTTRDRFDAHTVAASLQSDCGPDGGRYVPFKMPVYTAEEIMQLGEKGFGQCVADVLNLFFSVNLSGWDVECSVGRNICNIAPINHKILVAELWNNPQWSYAWLENTLITMVSARYAGSVSTSWLRIGTRIAVLFGLYAELLRKNALEQGQLFDISLPTGDFNGVMAVWYARQMNLPVANIIYACNENSGVWDLLHQGSVRTNLAVIATTTPNGDVALPAELERLISATLGTDEAVRFAKLCTDGGIYEPTASQMELLRKGMYSAVISMERLEAVIPNVYNTCGYMMNPYTALAYGALSDYRVKNAVSRPALLLADRHPVCDMAMVAMSMHMTAKELKSRLGVV